MEEYEETKDGIAFEVRQALRNLTTSRERIDITRARVESEAATVAAELKRYEVGVSTSYQVLEFQRFLAAAQESHIQAIVDYNKSFEALERARGTILETYGVSVESPELDPASAPAAEDPAPAPAAEEPAPAPAIDPRLLRRRSSRLLRKYIYPQ